ncbi:MAG: nucleoside-diphosphate sugar epimerase/dehydratase [bacterium]|nr:nucleoside-diphosphate sugar epimerase/dehydratase [bacterium]
MLREHYYSFLALILDILLINLALLLALLIHFEGAITVEHIQALSYTALLSSVVRVGTLAGYGLYRCPWRYPADLGAAIRIAKAVLTSSLLIVVILFVYPSLYGKKTLGLSGLYYPGPVFIIESLLCFLLIGISRFIPRILQTLRKKEKEGTKRVLIVGAGEAGEMLVHEMVDRPEFGYHPIGLVDDHRPMQGMRIHSVPVIGTIKDVPRLVEEKKADMVAIAIPSMGSDRSKQIYEMCRRSKVALMILPRIENPTEKFIRLSRLRNIQPEDLLLREESTVDIEEIASYLGGKTVMVTGAGGSIGSELCRQVAMFGPEKLLLLGRGENSIYQIMMELSETYPYLSLRPIIADIRDKPRIERLIEKYRPDIIFHAAAHKHVPLMELQPEEAIKNNVLGTKNLAEAACKYGVSRFVMTSSDKAVNPTNIMGASKRICELILQSKKEETKFVSVRFGNVLGSRGSVVPLFKKQIADGGPVTVTHPEITRYFMTIPEAVQLVLQAGGMYQNGQTFMLDMGSPVKVIDLAKTMIQLAGLEPEEDIKIEFTGLRPGEKLYEELLTASEGLKATKHHKILIGQPDVVNRDKLEKDIKILGTLAEQMKTEALIAKVAEIVPEYRPSRRHQDLGVVEESPLAA